MPEPGTTAGGLFSLISGAILKSNQGLYVGYGTAITEFNLDVRTGDFRVGIPNLSLGTNLRALPALGAEVASSVVSGVDPEFAQAIDRSVNPSVQNIDEIINTPLNTYGGTKLANGHLLSLYIDEIFENNPNNVFRVGAQLSRLYWNENSVKQENISYILNELPELRVYDIIKDSLFVSESGKIYVRPVEILERDGAAGLPEVFRFIKSLEAQGQLDGPSYQTRINNLATQLVNAGFPLNFGNADLANAIDRIKSDRGTLPLNPRYNEFLPLIQSLGEPAPILVAGLDELRALYGSGFAQQINDSPSSTSAVLIDLADELSRGPPRAARSGLSLKPSRRSCRSSPARSRRSAAGWRTASRPMRWCRT